MKIQIRRGVFETNSSSVHSITMCSDSEFSKWENGEVLFWGLEDKFATKEEIIEEFKENYPDEDWADEALIDETFSDDEIKTFEEFFENEYYETFTEEYITPNGEKVIAFGYYRHD